MTISKDFIEEIASNNEVSIVITLDEPYKSSFLQTKRFFNPNDFNSFGFDEKPHITVITGLMKRDLLKATSVLRTFPPFDIIITGVSVFKLKTREEVLVLRLDSEALYKMNKTLSSNLNIRQRNKYRPHLSIAYLKKGTGVNYIKEFNKFKGKKIRVEKVFFSIKNKKKVPINLVGINESFRPKQKINAPTMAYLTVYSEMPVPPIMGVEADHPKYEYNGVGIDEHIPKKAIENIMKIEEIETRASCEGSDERLLTFLIFRTKDKSEKTAKKIVDNINRKRGYKAMWNIGQGKLPRICVSYKLWYSKENRERFNKWWLRLPKIIRESM